MHFIHPKRAAALDKVLGAEVCAQIDNLPRAETDQHTHGAEGEPLHSLVGALVGITQPLLTGAEIIHFTDNLGNHLLNAAKVGLDGLEFLLGLDARPVTGVGANFNVEFNFTERVGNGVYREESMLGPFVSSSRVAMSETVASG